MNLLILVIGILWVFRMAKNILFWVYLWQLKEYHIGRFRDHFNTSRGRHLIQNHWNIVKIVLLGFVLFIPQAGILVLVLYFLEAGKVCFDAKQSSLTMPVATSKTAILVVGSLAVALGMAGFIFVSFLNFFLVSLLILDIVAPVLVSLVVLSLQPFAVLQRNRILTRARQKRASMSNLLVIGVAGSYGKSSTKEILSHILSKRFTTAKTKRNENSEVGIAKTILRDVTGEHEVFVCEMGAYNKGGIRLLASIALPRFGVISGINEQHMATFGSQENIVQGKYELIESLPQNGVSIFNGFNPYCERMYQATKGTKRKTGKGGDIWAENVEMQKQEISFIAVDREGERANVNVQVRGPLLENILLAMLAAKEVGMNLRESAEALRGFTGGLDVRKGVNGADIINSSYSANPTGAISDMDYLSLWKGKKVIVMPSLIELGSSSKEVHKRIGSKIAKTADFAIITTKDRFKEIKEGAVGAGMREEDIIVEEKSQKISDMLKELVGEGDAVLLEGRVPFRLVELMV